jgi:hypothetical protein
VCHLSGKTKAIVRHQKMIRLFSPVSATGAVGWSWKDRRGGFLVRQPHAGGQRLGRLADRRESQAGEHHVPMTPQEYSAYGGVYGL